MYDKNNFQRKRKDIVQMGLAASQARLLTITARLSDNELRSQTINNAKMRLAAQSAQASENYINALNNATLMFTSYDLEGDSLNQALTFNAMTSYSPYNTQYGLANAAGQLLVSEEEAKLFEESHGDLNAFLQLHGLTYATTYFNNPEVINLAKEYFEEKFGITESQLLPAPFDILNNPDVQAVGDEMTVWYNSYASTENAAYANEYVEFANAYIETERDYQKQLSNKETFKDYVNRELFNIYNTDNSEYLNRSLTYLGSSGFGLHGRTNRWDTVDAGLNNMNITLDAIKALLYVLKNKGFFDTNINASTEDGNTGSQYEARPYTNNTTTHLVDISALAHEEMYHEAVLTDEFGNPIHTGSSTPSYNPNINDDDTGMVEQVIAAFEAYTKSDDILQGVNSIYSGALATDPNDPSDNVTGLIRTVDIPVEAVADNGEIVQQISVTDNLDPYERNGFDNDGNHTTVSTLMYLSTTPLEFLWSEDPNRKLINVNGIKISICPSRDNDGYTGSYYVVEVNDDILTRESDMMSVGANAGGSMVPGSNLSWFNLQQTHTKPVTLDEFLERYTLFKGGNKVAPGTAGTIYGGISDRIAILPTTTMKLKMGDDFTSWQFVSYYTDNEYQIIKYYDSTSGTNMYSRDIISYDNEPTVGPGGRNYSENMTDQSRGAATNQLRNFISSLGEAILSNYIINEHTEALLRPYAVARFEQTHNGQNYDDNLLNFFKYLFGDDFNANGNSIGGEIEDVDVIKAYADAYAQDYAHLYSTRGFDWTNPEMIIGMMIQWNQEHPDQQLSFGIGFQHVLQEYMMEMIVGEYGSPKYAWVDRNDTSQTGNADSKAQWLTNLFKRMQSGYKALENGLAASKDWIEYALKTGIVTMEQVDQSYRWKSLDYKVCTRIVEKTDDNAVAKAEAEYSRAMNDIEAKDHIYDLQLKNIDTEHNALQQEYSVIKGVISKNIERTMKFNQSA